MRFQSSQASCGPTALYNAGCALGKKLSLEECEKACGTTATDGTPIRQLRRGAEKLGLKVMFEIRESRGDVATMLLEHVLNQGRAAVVAVDGDSHWVAAVGMNGSRFLIADSADNELVVSLWDAELGDRWKGAGRKGFYALVLG